MKKIALFVLLSGIVFLFQAGASLGATTLYYPNIVSDGTWNSEVGIVNTSATASLAGTLQAYDSSGMELSILPISLAPHARKEIKVGLTFSSPSQISYMILTTSSDMVRGYAKLWVDGSYRYAYPSTGHINTGTIPIPQVAINFGWWTEISLLNTTAAKKVVTINFNTGESKTVSLRAHEKKKFTVASLFNGQPNPAIVSGVISNAVGVVGVVMYGRSGSSGYSVLLNDKYSSVLYYPFFANDSTGFTGLLILNGGSSSANLAITPYSSSGIALSPQLISLSAGGQYVGAGPSAGFPAETAWLMVQADNPITGIHFFASTSGSQAGGHLASGTPGKTGVFARLEDSGWTKIALANTESGPATVSLAALDDYGTVLASESLSMVGHGNTFDSPDNIFTDDISTATFIIYSSSTDVVGSQLSGSVDDTLLDALPSLNPADPVVKEPFEPFPWELFIPAIQTGADTSSKN